MINWEECYLTVVTIDINHDDIGRMTLQKRDTPYHTRAGIPLEFNLSLLTFADTVGLS